LHPASHAESFALEKVTAPVGNQADVDAGIMQALHFAAYAGFQRVYLGNMMLVGVVEGAMGNDLGVLIVTEQQLENIGAGNLLLRNNLGMQAQVLAHIGEQLGIFRGFRITRVQQALPEPEFAQLRQHVVDGVVHGTVGIDQGGMPVEQDDVGVGARQLQNTHWRTGSCVVFSQGSLLQAAAKRIFVLICRYRRDQNSASREFSGALHRQ